MSKPDKQMRFWHFPKKWVLEESFWRDITTRTLSAGIVAIIGILAVKAGGFLTHVQWDALWRSIIAGGLLTTVVSTLGTLIAFWATAREARNMRNQLGDGEPESGR